MLLERWSSIATSNLSKTFLTDPPTLFTTQVLQPSTDPSRAEQRGTITEISSNVARARSDLGTATIIDTLEDTIWGTATACITSFADILCIALRRDDHEGGAGVEILPKMSLARFASENFASVEEDLRMRNGLRDTIDKLGRREGELSWIEKGGKKFSSIQVLEATLEYVEGLEGTKMIEERVSDDDVGSRMDIDSEKTLPVISPQLKKSIQSLKDQIQGTYSCRCAN
jgi:hypothetical protein